MPLKFITKHKEALKVSLKYELHKNMAKWEEARSHKNIHASELTKPEFCARKYALLDITGKKGKGQFIGTSLRATFDLGRALENMFRDQWLPSNVIVGDWVCNRCGHQIYFSKRPAKCPACTVSTLFTYAEVRVLDETTGVSGGVDVLVDLGEPRFRLVELKTMEKDGFKTLAAPLAEHRQRTSLYLKLVELSNNHLANQVNYNEGIICYVCKGFGNKDDSLKLAGLKDAPFSPFKEFFVKRNDDEATELLVKASPINLFRNSGVMPEQICPTSFCSIAKVCPCVTECFSGKYAAGEVYDHSGN